MLKHNHFLIFACIYIISSFAVHASPWHSQDLRQNLVFAISGGPTWASPGQSQNFSLQNDVQNYYENNGDVQNTLATGAIFLGTYSELNDAIQGQIGIELAYSGNAYASGIIWQNANSEANFQYSYHVNQFRSNVKAKLIIEDLPVTSMVQPYVDVSLGIGFNHTYDYQASALIDSSSSTSTFTDKTTYAFSYTAGGGIQIPIDPFWQIGVGYEFADWGKNQLGTAPGQTENLGHGLVMQNLYTSTVLITLAYTA